MKPCYVVGGGNFYKDDFCPEKNSLIIAADAGYKALTDIGITPDVVVGDFDSLGYTPDHPATEVHSPVKDDTDTMLAVIKGIEMGCDKFYIHGATGGRIAHTLGNLQVLAFLAKKGLAGYVIDRNTVITAAQNCKLVFDNKADGYISLIPFGCEKATLTIKGLKYGLERCDIPYNRPLGISNEFTGKKAEITVHTGSVIAVWENTDIFPERECVD